MEPRPTHPRRGRRRYLPIGLLVGPHARTRFLRTDADRGPQQERHTYEKCQYVEFKKRVAKMNELRAAKDGARSN